MTEEGSIGHGERIDEMKLQLQELKLINEDNTGLIALAAFQRLVEENINIRAKCKYISSKAKQYMVRTDQLKRLQSVIIEQNSYITEQNAFLHEAAEEVESQDKQIKALVLNLDEVYNKIASNSNSNVETFTNKYERAQVDFEYLEESRLLENAYYSDIVIAESILNLTADVEVVGIEKAVSVEIDNKPTITPINNTSNEIERSTPLFNCYSEDWTEQSISGSVISYRAPNEWIAEDWQRYSFKLKQALRMMITKLKSTLKNASDIRLGVLQLTEENKKINNINLMLQEKLASTQLVLDSKEDTEPSNPAPSNSNLQDDGISQIGYSYSESRVEDGDNKSIHAFSESTEVPLQEYQRNISNENLTNYSNIELIARIEELESRNKQLLQRLDREIKTKLKVEEMRRAQQAELKQIKKNLFRIQEKPQPTPNNSSNHIAASSSSADEVSRGSSVSSIDSSVLFMKRFPQAKATAADKLVNLSLSMSKNAEAVDRLLMGWTVTQHFKFSFSKERVAVVDVFSRTLRIMPPRSNSNKLSGEVVELVKIHRVDKGISPSLVHKPSSRISISSCITLLLSDGNSLDFELASSEERDEFFEGILGVLARFNPEFRSVDGGVSYYPSFDPSATMYALDNEDSIDRDLDDSSSLNSLRGSVANSSADLGKSRRLKLPRGSSAVGALKDAGVLHRRETGLRELGLISDDEDDDDDNSTVMDKEYDINITRSKSTLGGWMTKRKIVDASQVRTDTVAARPSLVKQNPNSIAPFPYDGGRSDPHSHSEAEILFGNIYGTPSKAKTGEFGNSPAGSLSEFVTDNPISAPEGESASPFLQTDRRSHAAKGHKKNFSLLSHLNFPDLSNITNSSSHQNSNYEGFCADAASGTGESSHSSVQHASKLLSGIQITPYSFENGYQQLNRVTPTGEGSGTTTTSAAATAAGFRSSASRAFAAEHAAFRRRIQEGKAARAALQQKQMEQRVAEEGQEEVEEGKGEVEEGKGEVEEDVEGKLRTDTL